MVTNDARCSREIKSNVAMEKAALNKKAHQNVEFNLRKKEAKCYF
jgi:hypothetical protein